MVPGGVAFWLHSFGTRIVAIAIDTASEGVPVTASSSPTARRFELARRLRELRAESGHSVDDVAKELECSPTKISRIETGQRVATALDVKVLARFYGLSDRVLADLMSLAVEARKRGWWHDYRSLDEQTRTFLGLETAASRIYQVETVRLPGLLQTDAYARALVPRLRSPQYWATESNPDEIVATRVKRQQRVLDGSLQLSAIMDEAALSRKIGEPWVLPEQVAYLVELAALPNVDIQVTTFELGSHPGMDGSFNILTFEVPEMPDVVFLEGLAGQSIIRADDRPDVVQNFHDAFAFMASASAMSTADTLTWLHQLHSKFTQQSD